MREKRGYTILLMSVFLLLGLVWIAFTASSQAGAQPREILQPETLSDEEVYVPAGEYTRGCAVDVVGYLGCSIESGPLGAIYIDAFYIDKTEVTNAQYARCVANGVCKEPLENRSTTRTAYYNNPAFAQYPVIHVDFERANTYCQWAGKRLPTEGEWEKAARGTDRRWFPWGNDTPTCDLLNSAGCIGDTAAVGSYPAGASPYGAMDMAGNVREWVSDLYDKGYYRSAPYYNPQGPEWTVANEHLVRGGSWNDIYTHYNVWVRLDEHDIYETHLIGFRCARTATGGTPTPTPSPTPTPTPTPYAHTEIDAAGGAIWLAYPDHLTLLTLPENALNAQTAFTLSYSQPPVVQNLHTNNHAFSVDFQQSVTETAIIPPYLDRPVRLTVGYHETLGIITNTLDLYRLTASGWTTDQITKIAQTPDYIIADIHWPGLYSVMGDTNRTYLPLVLRR